MHFRLSTTKFSALCIRNRANFLHRIFSISSACLTLIDIRTLLIDPSMYTFSASFRDIVIGVSSTSFDCLCIQCVSIVLHVHWLWS